MQSRKHSLWEVGIDWVIMILINISAQILVYQTHASFFRVSFFTLAILGFAYPRRYIIRRMFNKWKNREGRQTRRQSAIEVIADTVFAIAFAFLLQLIVYYEAATWARAGTLTILLYLIAMVRRYIIRRIFVRWESPSRTTS